MHKSPSAWRPRWTPTSALSANPPLGNEGCSDGTQTTYAVDSAGSTTAETTTSASGQSANATTTYVYDSSHRVTQQTDYQGPNVAATTNSTYNASGDLTEEQRLDGASNVISDSKWTLDAQGRTTSEMRLVSGTPASGTYRRRS